MASRVQKMNPSIAWRQQGNDIFRSIEKITSPVLLKARLEEAAKCYQHAIQEAGNGEDKASALKNKGVVSLKLANLIIEKDSRPNDTDEQRLKIEFYLTEAIKNFSQAHSLGVIHKSRAWTEQVLTSCTESMQVAVDYEMMFDIETRTRQIVQWILALPHGMNKGQWNLELAKAHFHIALDAVEKQDYKKALYQLHECYRPTEEAERDAKEDAWLQSEISVMRTDVWIHMCIAESQQARSIGDHYLEVGLKDTEELNVNLIWDVVDWYRKAILLTQEHDVENEAITYSRLGHLYDKVLKLKYKAKENYKICLELSQSLYPKIFTTFEWYQECVQTLERYQQEAVARDERAYQKEKEEALKDFKHDLAKLEKKDAEEDGYPTAEFLKFLYATFPPKNKRHKLRDDVDKLEGSALKKTYQKAILHYHPDRQEKYGKGWKFFCDEVTKKLNKRHDCMKGV